MPRRRRKHRFTLEDYHKDLIVQLANGASNQDIAREMEVSCESVEYYLRRLRQILRAENRTHIVAIALVAGIVPPEAVDLAGKKYASVKAREMNKLK